MDRFSYLIQEVTSIAQDLEIPHKMALSDLQQSYRRYFMEKMEEHGVNSPSSFQSADDMKAFFDDVKAGWEKGKGRKG